MKKALALIGLFVIAACGQTPQATAGHDQSQMSSATRLPAPSPLPVGTPVPRQVLPPASTMPVVSLCMTSVVEYQDGNAGPLFCRDGSLNIAAWRYFAGTTNHVMSLSPSASLRDVQAGMCSDMGHSTIPIEESGYDLAAAYNGWTFDFDPVLFLINGGCH